MAGPQATAAGLMAEKLGYVFTNTALLDQALTHSTWANQHGNGRLCYERLEFLGDAVLQLLSSAHLFAALPTASEGALSRRRAQLVREPTLAALALELDIAPHVRMGGSEAQDQVPHSILADIMEAILAAVYLDGGLNAATAVFATFMPRLETLGHAHIDHKTQLQEACHRQNLPSPQYVISAVTGPAHARHFHVLCNVGTDVVTSGVGTSKKAAEQLCARQALVALGLSQQS